MNTKIIKQLSKSSKNKPPILRNFVIKRYLGFMTNLGTSYYFIPSEEYEEDGVYNPDYIDKGIALKTGYPIKEYPELDHQTSTASIDVKMKDLKQLIKFTSKDKTHPVLQTLMLRKFDGKYKLVATDGYALAWQDVTATDIPNISHPINLPAEFIKYVTMLKTDKVKIELNDEYAWASYLGGLDYEMLISRMKDHEQPDLDRILNQHDRVTIKQIVDLASIPKDVFLDLEDRIFKTKDDDTKVNIQSSISEPMLDAIYTTSDSGFIIMPIIQGEKSYLSTKSLHKIKAKKVEVYSAPNQKEPVFIKIVEQ